MKFKFKTTHRRILADTTTPVSIYLRLRDTFPNSILLESSEYNSRDNNISYICCQSIASILLDEGQLMTNFPDGSSQQTDAKDLDLRHEVSKFRESFQTEPVSGVNVISNGLFGYFSFRAIEHFEDIQLTATPQTERDIPILQYHVYRFVIAIDHFRNQLHVFENLDRKSVV